ncbi:hypothetical protein OG302_13970 [Streptomyces sp. NBC_01283]|uniref:hypothetical protein n=1 Tax=Streptomyces sp. NBC_01283 TaxID=2903812 RepID=UPI00352FC09A|nr:hypothetical protein OG302_13970 [Streptomyces sp. NBC_01283]
MCRLDADLQLTRLLQALVGGASAEGPDGTVNDPAAPPAPLPHVGQRVAGVVGQHGDRQIKIRVGLPFRETHASGGLSDGGTNAP